MAGTASATAGCDRAEGPAAKDGRSPVAAFAAILALAVLAMMLLLAPIPGSVDTHAYKDAAVNLAEGRGLTSAFAFGNPTMEPRLFAGYPPGFPVLYGGYLAVAGVSPEADSLFERVSEALLVLLIFAILVRAFREARGWQAAALALLLLAALPGGFLLLQHDRPDFVGLILALCALLRAPGTLPRVAAIALLAGVTFVVSPICGLLAVAGVALRWCLQPPPRPGFAATAGLGALGFVLPMAAALAIGTAFEPDYAARLFTYLVSAGAEDAAGVTTGAGDFIALLRGEFATWWHAFSVEGFSSPHAYARGLLLVVALPLCTLLLLRARPLLPPGRLGWTLLVLWGAALLSLTIVPWSRLYPAMAAGVLLCATVAALPAALWRGRGPRRLLLGGVALMVAIQLPFTAAHVYFARFMASSYERARATLGALPFEDATGDGRVVVQVDPFAYFLVKPRDVAIVPLPLPQSAAPEVVAATDYLVLSYPGSGDPLSPHRPYWWATGAGDFELLHRPDLPQRPYLLGRALSNSSQTWELEIWRRQTP